MTDTNNLRLLNGNPIAEYFANELASVEDLGKCVRLTFAVPRQMGREAYREPVVSVIVPTAILSHMIGALNRPPLEIKNNNDEAEPDASDRVSTLH